MCCFYPKPINSCLFPPSMWGFDPLVTLWFCLFIFRHVVITFIPWYGVVFFIEMGILFHHIQYVKIGYFNFASFEAYELCDTKVYVNSSFVIVFYYWNALLFYQIIVNITYVFYLFYCIRNPPEFATYSYPFPLNFGRAIRA